jgi:hypothetical protein
MARCTLGSTGWACQACCLLQHPCWTHARALGAGGHLRHAGLAANKTTSLVGATVAEGPASTPKDCCCRPLTGSRVPGRLGSAPCLPSWPVAVSGPHDQQYLGLPQSKDTDRWPKPLAVWLAINLLGVRGGLLQWSCDTCWLAEKA